MEIVYVSIDSLRVNPKKLRKLSVAKIRRYAMEYEAGDEFPPLTVLDCGSFYTIRDGRHRYQAQLACGYRTVAVIVLNRWFGEPASRREPALLCGRPVSFAFSIDRPNLIC
jgi:hypothetical protein